MEEGGLILGTGTTSIQTGGKYPSQSEALNIAAMGSHIIKAKSFNIEFGSPSGPGDL